MYKCNISKYFEEKLCYYIYKELLCMYTNTYAIMKVKTKT